MSPAAARSAKEAAMRLLERRDYGRDELAAKLVEKGFEAYAEKAPEYLQAFEDAGCEVIWLTDEEREQWKANTSNTYATWKEKVGSDLFDQAAEYIETVIKPAMED